MHDAILEFLQAPNRSHYRSARKQLFACPKFSHASLQIAKMGSVLGAADYEAVFKSTATLLPQCGLSPRAHRFWSIAAAELTCQAEGRRRSRFEEAAELHRFGYEACLVGLAATGDGSPAKPFLPTYASDEYELAEYLQLGEIHGQKVVQRGRKTFDVMEAAGGVMWFDITELLPRVPVLRRKPLVAATKQR